MYAITKEGGMLMSPADVCLTPAGPVVVPIPYPNIGEPEMGEPACERVLINGTPSLNMSSTVMPSNGDQAGVMGGVVCGEIMGEVKFTEGSEKVTLAGSPAVRLTSSTTHNENNAVGACLVPSQTKVLIME
ncbi:DUF4150 domain-containing protein [Desulfovibrio inopinatus]|uniref:DUF4150 domain-containing protein n=1 Tax=Desulfovibrio inopinatus TaxID=102109 RepID=UPI00040F726E|nr:DUF4150 domain-containing protein [Desulfovibrio inopinatus]